MELNTYYDVDTQVNKKAMSMAFARVMKSVYLWMALALVMTAFTAMIVADSPNLVMAIATNKLLFFGILLAEIGLVIYMTSALRKLSFMTAGVLFAVYAILNGVTMAFIFILYTAESIAATFFVTAGTFALMSIIGYAVKKDLSAMGRFLMMLLVGLIVATVANMFFANSAVAVICNYVGVFLFVCLTAYDTQKIKQIVQEASLSGDEDATNKLALMGSLTLYLDFINLFLYLLRILGNRK